MNKFILNTTILSLFLIIGTIGFAQLETVELPILKDSYTTTKYPGAPYGSSTSMKSSTYNGWLKGTFVYARTFVECDLSSIPYNATILSASIKLKSTAVAIGSFTWKTKLVTGSWVESTMTHSNGQPTISGLAIDITTTTPSGTTSESLDVTSMVQRMVLGTTTNYGWCIQVSNEAYQGNTGATFYTSDYVVPDNKPYLEVQYYVPLSIATATVTHETGVALSDGGVAFTFTGGASNAFNYYWTDAAGNSISTTLASSSPVALQNQPYGWYGLHMVGTTYNEELYQAFLVGTECEEVTITFQPNGNFTDDALLYDRTGFKDVNYGGYILMRAENYYSTFKMRNMLGFKLWMDDAFTVNQADMTLYGWNHSNIVGTNEGQFKKATGVWEEDLVTHNTMPTTSYPYASLAMTTTSNQNDIVDLTDFWNDWKQNNTTNYGMLYQLLANNSTHRKRRGYYSASYWGNTPSIEFKVSLIDPGNALYCNPNATPFNKVKRGIDAGHASAFNNEIKFTYNEEYHIASGKYLVYNLYNSTGQIIGSCGEDGIPSSGMTAFTYDIGDNSKILDLSNAPGIANNSFYLLEVFTSNGEKRFLKFYLKA
jgi:hypothetical protein